MSSFQLAGRRWLLRGFLAGRPLHGGPPTRRMVGPPQGLPRRLPEHILGAKIVRAVGSSEPMEDTDSTEVKYKIRQWSLPGAAIVPVLNVSSRVFWLELDDKALLDSYGVLQEGILCDVFSQKCSAAWQGARGERITISVMLPGQEADDWLNFMLSQKTLWLPLQRGVLSQRKSQHRFFFLDNAALVVTTVAVMKLCCTSHRLITRSHRFVTAKQETHKAKQKTPPNKTTNTKPTKRAQSMKGETSETCSLSLPGA